MKSVRRNKVFVFCLFVIPALILFTVLVLIPFVKTFLYSLTDWNGISKDFNYVGLKNFENLWNDRVMRTSLINNMKFCIWGGFFTFLFALLNAVLATQSRLREKKLYRIILFIPNVLPGVIIALLWKFVFTPNFGLLNSGLEMVGLEALTKNWLGDKSTVIACLIFVWVWCSIGFYMVLFISAIESIPTSFFEAAELDGANAWQRFWTVTWPLLKETTKTAVVYFFINAFSGCYSLVRVMTEGGPARASEVMTSYMFTTAFSINKFAYASAMGVVIFLVIMIASAILLLLTRTKDPIEY